MARLFISGAMLVAMLGGADAHVRFAADYSVGPYLNDRSLGVRHGAPVYMPSRPDRGAPMWHTPVYRSPVPRVPQSAMPARRHELTSPSKQPAANPVSNPSLLTLLLLVLTGGCVAAAATIRHPS